MRSMRWMSGLVSVGIALVLVGCATTGAPRDSRKHPIALTNLTAALEEEMAGVATQLAALAAFHADNAGDAAALATYAAQLFGDAPVSVFAIANDGTQTTLHDSGRFGEERPPLQVAGAESDEAIFATGMIAPEGVVADAAIKSGDTTLVARVLASELAARTVDEQLAGTHIDAWIMEPDGLQVYDADPEEIGRNLLTDPFYAAYPELQALVQQMAKTDSGTGVYTFLNTGFQSLVDKRATWATAHFGNRAWRVVAVELISGETGEVLGLPQDLDVMWDVRAIKTMTATPAWKTAFATADEATLRQEFDAVLEEHELIYSMACVFPDGVIRYGEPPTQSFDGYDLKEARIDRDAVLLAAARSIADSWHVFELVEGGRGLFYVLPVFIDAKQAGAIYAIWLLPDKE